MSAAQAFRNAVARDQQAAVMRALESARRETFGALALLESMWISGHVVAATDLTCEAVAKIDEATTRMELWAKGEEHESPVDVCRAMRFEP